MERFYQLPASRSLTAPETALSGSAAPGEKAADPFPVADVPGRPYIRPATIAGLTRGDEMLAAIRRLEGAPVHIDIEDGLNGARDVVIFIGLLVLTVGCIVILLP